MHGLSLGQAAFDPTEMNVSGVNAETCFTGFAGDIGDEDAVLWGPEGPLTFEDPTGHGYTQTYVLMRPSEASSCNATRSAFFRYGNWCYAGQITLRDPFIRLEDLPLMLRDFQRQQGQLAYMCEYKQLPPDTPYSEPLAHFSMAARFIEKEITASEEILTNLSEYLQKRGMPCWIDEDDGRSYFELQVA